MAGTGITHVLFDFFGTLVDYVPGRAVAVPRSWAFVRSLGVDVDERVVVDLWSTQFACLESRSAASHREFSMSDVARGFLLDALGLEPNERQVSALVTTYMSEWNALVRYPNDTCPTITTLSTQFRLAVVTNTHDVALVPAHLKAMGIADLIETVITSVEVGWRKPHPAIYSVALEHLGINPRQAVFVGDTYESDFCGPQAEGIFAFLLDPGRRHHVPDAQHLDSIAELPERLAALQMRS
ncbi:MAG: HAD family hydrolase [Nakamurella sp.]